MDFKTVHKHKASFQVVYRKTGTRDPSGILAGSWKTGTLEKPDNRYPRP